MLDNIRTPNSERRRAIVYQDGADFYDATRSPALIFTSAVEVTYPSTTQAELARREFVQWATDTGLTYRWGT
jgi:hypothetical protein